VDATHIGAEVNCSDCATAVQVPLPAFEFDCPQCSQRFHGAASLANITVNCPNCQRAIALTTAETPKKLSLAAPPPVERVAREPRTKTVPNCPACRVRVSQHDDSCPKCGLDLKLARQIDAETTPAPVPLHDVLKGPFHGDLLADALLMLMRGPVWSAVVAATAVANAFLGAAILQFVGVNFPALIEPAKTVAGGYFYVVFAVVLMGGLTMWVALRAFGWFAQQCFAIAAQYEGGAVMAEPDKDALPSLGLWSLVNLIAWGPLAAGGAAVLMWGLGEDFQLEPLGAAQTAASVIVLLVGVVWALAYWPMGMAMAGAYGTVSPVRVTRKILSAIRSYVAVVPYQVLFFALASFIGALLLDTVIFGFLTVGGVVRHLRVFGFQHLLQQPGHMSAGPFLQELVRSGFSQPFIVLVSVLVASLVGVVFLIYVVLSQYAVLGVLLKKYKLPSGNARGDTAAGFAWVGGMFAAVALMLALRLSPVWPDVANAVYQARARAEGVDPQTAQFAEQPSHPVVGEFSTLVLLVKQLYRGSAVGEEPQWAAAPHLPAPAVASAPNRAPKISQIPNQTVDEDGVSGPHAFSVSDVETAAGALEVVAQSSNQRLFPTDRISIRGRGGARTVTLRPAPNENGQTEITITVSDGSAATAAKFLLTVNAINDAPVASEDNFSVDEDMPLNAAAPGLFSNDRDVEGDALTAALVNGPASAATFQLNPDGSFLYLARQDFNGSDSFTYKANDGQADSNTATVSITINPVNDAPVTADDNFIVDEDAPLSATAPGPLGNDRDVDGDALKVTLMGSPSRAATFQLNPDGSFVYLARQDFNGSDSFTYKANDGQLDSNTATVSIMVNPVNDAPVAAGDKFTVDEDTPLETVAPGPLTNDTDVDTGDTLRAVLVDAPANAATFQLNPDGSFLYLSRQDYNGKDSFSYRASDGQAESNVVTVSITINPVNDAPVAGTDAFSVDEDLPLGVAAPGLLANDRDVDGDPLRVLLVNGPLNAATFQLNPDGSFLYLPRPDFNGKDQFAYTANDSALDSSVTSVSLTVNPVNDAPAAQDDSFSVETERPLAAAAPGLLGNDRDVDGDALTAMLVRGPAHAARFSLKPDGSFNYTPKRKFSGRDEFIYKTSDGVAESDAATVTITVLPPQR
jgi:VCBS repeat-containing protein